MNYFVNDLFKPPVKTQQEYVQANDPFIREDVIKHYSCLNNFAKGVDTAHSLGVEFFREANKIQNERETLCLAEEAANKEKEEERLKEERLVKKQLDDTVAKVFKSHKVYVKRSCPVKIPYKSELTHEEHALYLASFLKYQTRAPKTSLEKQEHQAYLCMQNRVFEEQQSLMEFAKKVSSIRLKDYNEVSPVIEEYVSRYLKQGFSRVLHYPPLYHLEQEIPLRPQDPNNTYSNLTFEHVGHLLSIGVVPWLRLPYPNARLSLPSDDKFLKSHPPEQAPMPKEIRPEFKGRVLLNKTPVSDDPNCSFLAAQHRASIVMSPSAVKTLLDNPAPNFDKEWDIPVVIRSFPVTEPDGSTSQHRVVFIDKPIKKKLWTPLEKKALFFKKSALTALAIYRNKPMFRMKAPKVFYKCFPDNDPHVFMDSRSFEPATPSSSYEPSVPSSLYEPSVPSEPSTPDELSGAVNQSNCDGATPRSPAAAVDAKQYAKQNFVSFVSSRDGKSYGESIFDDPFGLSEVNNIEIEEFGVDRKVTPPTNLHTKLNTNGKGRNLKRKHADAFCSTSDDAGSQPKQKNTFKSGYVDTIFNNTKSQNNSKVVTDTSSLLNNVTRQNTAKDAPLQTTKAVGSAAAGNVLDDLLGEEVSPSKVPLEAKEGSKPQKCLLSGRQVGEDTTQNYNTQRPTKKPWSQKLDTDWTEHTKPSIPTPGTTVNYHYHLFSLHSTTAGPSHTALPPITVLVRNHLHGLSMENVNKPDKAFKSEPYVVFPKLENQLFFGCEVNTHTEVVQQWAELLVRPNANILQVRLCGSSGDVVLSEKRDLSEVLREGHKPHIRFQPATSLTSLYAALNSLKGMPSGHYFLHHPNKSEAFIRLLKSVDEKKSHCGHQSTFNLHVSYGYQPDQNTTGEPSSTDGPPQVDVIDSRQYVTPPWLAIDTHVPTPFHLFHKKIPGTFPMANPDKKLSKKQKRFIKERAKKKHSIFDMPEEAQRSKDVPTPSQELY